MADEVEKLAGNLRGLNDATLNADKGFQGFTKRMIKLADVSNGAGRQWTIFQE